MRFALASFETKFAYNVVLTIEVKNIGEAADTLKAMRAFAEQELIRLEEQRRAGRREETEAVLAAYQKRHTRVRDASLLAGEQEDISKPES